LELQKLTDKYRCEFAVTYVLGSRRKGGGGTYWLHSGAVLAVSPPREHRRMLVVHTHPDGDRGGSFADRHNVDSFQGIANPQRSSVVVAAGREPSPGRRPLELGMMCRFDARTPSAELARRLEAAGVVIASNAEISAFEDPRSSWRPAWAAIARAADCHEAHPALLNENTLSDVRQIDRAFRSLGARLDKHARFAIMPDGHLHIVNLGRGPLSDAAEPEAHAHGGYTFHSPILAALARDADEAIASRKTTDGVRQPYQSSHSVMLRGYRLMPPGQEGRTTPPSQWQWELPGAPLDRRYRKGPELIGKSTFKEIYSLLGRPDIVLAVHANADSSAGEMARHKLAYWSPKKVQSLMVDIQRNLQALSALGLPVIHIEAIGSFDERPALVVERALAATDDAHFATEGWKRLNERSVASIDRIEKILRATAISIPGFALFLRADGSLVLGYPSGAPYLGQPDPQTQSVTECPDSLLAQLREKAREAMALRASADTRAPTN
jgi:hypothetical protein